MRSSFHIVLTGRLLPEAEAAFVWDDVAERFKLDPLGFEKTHVPRLPCVIKRVHGAHEGAPYIKALTQAGAEAWSVHEPSDELWYLVGEGSDRRGPVGPAFLRRALADGLLEATTVVTRSEVDEPVCLKDLFEDQVSGCDPTARGAETPVSAPEEERKGNRPLSWPWRGLRIGALMGACLVLGISLGVLGARWWSEARHSEPSVSGVEVEDDLGLLAERGFFGVPLTAGRGRGACASSLTYRSEGIVETSPDRSTRAIPARYQVWEEGDGSLVVQVRPDHGGAPLYRIAVDGEVALLNVHQVMQAVMTDSGSDSDAIASTLRRVPSEQSVSRCGMTGPMTPALPARPTNATAQASLAEPHRPHLVQDPEARFTFEGVRSCDDVRYAFAANYHAAGRIARVAPDGLSAPAGTPIMFRGTVLDWIGDGAENLFLVHMKVDQREFVTRVSGEHFQIAVGSGRLSGSAFTEGEFCGVGIMEEPQPSLFHNGDLILPVVAGQAPFQFNRSEELAHN